MLIIGESDLKKRHLVVSDASGDPGLPTWLLSMRSVIAQTLQAEDYLLPVRLINDEFFTDWLLLFSSDHQGPSEILGRISVDPRTHSFDLSRSNVFQTDETRPISTPEENSQTSWL